MKWHRLRRIAAGSAAVVLAAALALGCSGGPGGQLAIRTEQCQPIDDAGVAALFDRWNATLQTGDAHAVVANYAEDSILLPTLSDTPRLTAEEKIDYFEHFLADGPVGVVTQRFVDIGCNSAVDAGLYTFTFAATGAVANARYSFSYAWNGQDWLITTHHSSLLPGQP